LANRREWLDAGYVINLDAAGGQIQHGRRLRLPVQTSEKIYATYLLEVTGPGGHSSMPQRNNTIYTLAHGLERLAAYAFPVRLTETTRSFFGRLGRQIGGETGRDLQAIAEVRADRAAVARVSETPMYNSSMRNTCVATMLEAGHAENALPQRAKATVQCRLLPGESATAIRDTLARVVGDTAIRVTIKGGPAGAPPEGAPESLLPVMDPWTSDGSQFRRAGLPVYGVSGVFNDIDEDRAHGQDERVSAEALYEGVEFNYRLMKALTGAP
jgi:acetylornithine deacetylase/succinyl-diaminopimelate desuccinylase-like protein